MREVSVAKPDAQLAITPAWLPHIILSLFMGGIGCMALFSGIATRQAGLTYGAVICC